MAPLILQPTSPQHLAHIRTLFEEYAAALHIDLCFQNFTHELATLPGKYAPPAGALLLATLDGLPAGCVALRPLAPATCEMKRLYVRPPYRRTGLGRTLTLHILQAARDFGYHRIRLDTLASLTSALALYQSLGFKEIPPYYANPHPGALFLELQLQSPTP